MSKAKNEKAVAEKAVTEKATDEQPRLEVYLDRSVLVLDGKPPQEFKEGNPSKPAKDRLQKIREQLEAGFLTALIDECRKPAAEAGDPVSEAHGKLLAGLVDSVTSEVGRALVGLTVLQVCVKAIAPDQSIRLHKAGGKGSNFSWVDGIPMRVLDKNFITPTLRKQNLLKLNADGFMMTRSLAENYPYSRLYKAAIKGARKEWLEIVDLVETEEIKARSALKHLIGLLLNRSAKFQAAVEVALKAVEAMLPKIKTLDNATNFIRNFVDQSPYSARVFEIAMHALFQVLEDAKVFGGVLKPLCQMRSANKKHGNIGDIEIIKKKGGLEILEAWDAKYGKPYLRDELDEVSEKLEDHSETEAVGFVVDTPPNLKAEITDRLAEVEGLHGVTVAIQEFGDWVNIQAARAVSLEGDEVGRQWIMAFVESLCERRRERAPIDEPADAWVVFLTTYTKTWKPS